MKNKICIYHDNCNDGFLAATIVWRKYGEDCEYFPATYGEEPPDVTGKDVYIVDFSYKRDVLEKMNKQARSLMVLDHHKTAEEDLKDLPYCVFDMNKSGARLAWERFQGTFPIPEVVLCVEDRDLWLYNRPQTKKLHAYLGTLERKFSVWTILFDDDVLLHAAQYGEYILKYRDIKNAADTKDSWPD